jgi:hypothetical protein
MMLMRMFFQVQVVAAEVMVMPRIEEDALGRRRLAGVDVRHDTDVPATIQRCSACHGLSLICEQRSR